ncbi:MAG: HIT domain-containing protein [Steroidobacteraceae bacterium]
MVLIEERVFVIIPHSHYGDIRGNVLIIPRQHYENLLDIPDSLGADIFNAARTVSRAMIEAFGCEGISTRQHNGPAGNQDVWHYHLHVFPRFTGDHLWGGDKGSYSPAERLDIAERLRTALVRRS